jgi:predicted transglutaminase-like cysteine proteinase
MKIIKYEYQIKFLFICLITAVLCQREEKPINIKVVPAKSNKLTLDDLDEIKMEVLHDMNTQLKDLEDDIAEKERLKEKTSSTWTLTVSL